MSKGLDAEVYDAVVYDPDGPGGTDFMPALYVATPSDTLGYVVRWNGLAWEELPGRPTNSVYDLQLWDRDGPGGLEPALIAAGVFTTASEESAQGFARFDSGGWRGLGNGGPSDYGIITAVIDPDGPGSAGESLYGVIGNPGVNRRLAKLRFINATTSVWDDAGIIGSTAPAFAGFGLVNAVTIDDDAAGRRPESIVLGGDLSSNIDNITTDGLIRFTAANPYLVDDIFATLNGAGAYLCGMIAGASDTVTFDYYEVTGNPDQVGYADLIGPVTFGAMEVLNGDVVFDLFESNMTLLNPVSLVVGDGPESHVRLYFTDSGELGGRVTASSVSVARSATQEFVSQSMEFANTELLVNDAFEISREGSGGVAVFNGNSAELTTIGPVSIATDPFSVGELFIINGATWTHDAGGVLDVGGAGAANIDVDSGSSVNTNFNTIMLGSLPSGEGRIDIGSAFGATWQNSSGTVFVGHQGRGHLLVHGQSNFLNPDSHLVVGHLAGSSGDVEMRGNVPEPGPSQITTNEISIGRFGGAGRVYFNTDSPGSANMLAFNITVGTDGLVQGAGTFDAAGVVENRGLIAPGDVIGLPTDRVPDLTNTIVVDGNYRQLSAPANDGIPGRLAIDIEGIGAGLSDVLQVFGTAELGGQLDVRFVNGYEPTVGELASGLNIVESNTPIVGAFDVANFPGLRAGVTGAPRFLRFEVLGGARGGSVVRVIEDTLASPPPAAVDDSQDYDVGGAGNDAALGDLNGDGVLDLAITIPNPTNPANAPGSVVLLFNAGSVDGFWQGFTTTTQITVPANPAAVAIADFDGVNGNDVCFTALSTGAVYVLLNDGAGNFSFLRGTVPPTTVTGLPRNLVQSDFNRDGAPDVAVITDGDPTVTLLVNDRPGGTFTGFVVEQVIPIPPTMADGIAVDIDNDKWDDIVVPDEDDESITLQNNGPTALRGMPTFNPTPVLVPVPGRPVDVDAADLNLDGFADVAFASRDGGTVTILLGNGTPSFLPPITVPAGTGPSDLALVDLDSDNDGDIAVITGNVMNERIVRVIRNDLFGGLLSFAPQADLLPGATPELVLGGDVTGDGNPDLVTVNNDGGVRGGAGQDEDVSVFTFAACRGDANNDRVVDMEDISATLTNWLIVYSPGTGPGDSNGDGQVNFRDITDALESWGRDCR